MDWIWSSRSHQLLCTSTQSSNFKWVSGGGINSPRHQTSCWLKAAESSTVGWSDAMFFRASVHPVLLAVASTAHDRWHNCSDAMLRRSVGSSGAEDLVAKTSLVASTWPSDEPLQTLRFIRWILTRLCLVRTSSSDRLTVLPMERRFIRRYYLLFFSATRPRLQMALQDAMEVCIGYDLLCVLGT
jgi:hypothetical protein